MGSEAFALREARQSSRDPRFLYGNGPYFRHLCATLFESLTRSDQRLTGMQYLLGLLEVEGRKSTRNIASWSNVRASEQSLHHFVNDSCWDWRPMRRALAEYMMSTAPPAAWVVRPVVIPKAGRHSVGVDRRFIASMGKMVNSQQAVAVVAASEFVHAPISWRLRLSTAWLDDPERRGRASIPDEVGAETLSESMIAAVLQAVRRSDLPVLPVILDATDTDVMAIINSLRAAGLRVLARVAEPLLLDPIDPAFSSHHDGPLPGNVIMGALRDMRRAVTWSDDAAGGAVRTSVIASVQVRRPGRGGQESTWDTSASRNQLRLMGMSELGEPWPSQLWLTNVTDAPPEALFRMTKLLTKVDAGFRNIGDDVGLRDFTGRSFSGWHRHVTLASAAYAVTALNRTAWRQRAYHPAPGRAMAELQTLDTPA